MKKSEIITKLRDDEHYYGDFGKQYLSNSDVSILLGNPLALGKTHPPNPNFLVGGYFHTAILQPDKLKKYKIINTTTRDVTTESPVLKVRYLNTLRKEYCSIKDVSKLNNI